MDTQRRRDGKKDKQKAQGKWHAEGLRRKQKTSNLELVGIMLGTEYNNLLENSNKSETKVDIFSLYWLAQWTSPIFPDLSTILHPQFTFRGSPQHHLTLMFSLRLFPSGQSPENGELICNLRVLGLGSYFSFETQLSEPLTPWNHYTAQLSQLLPNPVIMLITKWDDCLWHMCELKHPLHQLNRR